MSAQAAKALCLHGALLVSYLFILYANKKEHKMCALCMCRCVMISCVRCQLSNQCISLLINVVGNNCLEWFLNAVW